MCKEPDSWSFKSSRQCSFAEGEKISFAGAFSDLASSYDQKLSSSNCELQPSKCVHALQSNSSLSPYKNPTDNCLQLHKASQCTKCPSCLQFIKKETQEKSHPLANINYMGS